MKFSPLLVFFVALVLCQLAQCRPVIGSQELLTSAGGEFSTLSEALSFSDDSPGEGRNGRRRREEESRREREEQRRQGQEEEKERKEIARERSFAEMQERSDREQERQRERDERPRRSP
ncbi:hypothetical protein BKA69DRAFT_1046018 [Paraphysoderma sedebokerense]|nr:hypothetical protein BKA69DRAFT_1046018 [Paraphysoderma sedebokerense]